MLKKHRPDLNMTAFDAAITGLICITALAPDSEVLFDRYDGIAKEMAALKLVDFGLEAYLDLLSIESTSRISTEEDITARFWM
jgi:hypothetical protein